VKTEVSVVIPTHDRPELVRRAVESALAQTVPPSEVIVVLDGPQPETRRTLRAIEQATDRLRVEGLARRTGVGAARNAGVAAARFSRVALLDDDDHWLPRKLELQLRAADACVATYPIVASRVIARDGSGSDVVWPRRLPAAHEHPSDYLFSRHGLFWGEALVHTSTLLVPTELLRLVPFDETLRCHEDLDWLIRACAVPGARLEFAAPLEPLAVWSIDENRPRVSTVPDWRRSLAWAESRKEFLTHRAYAAYLLSWIGSDAARERSLEALWRLPWQAFWYGKPAPLDLLLFSGTWLVPQPIRLHLSRFRHAARRSRRAARVHS
jgi:glycosyltransferase involved in cell wall biosynthesis